MSNHNQEQKHDANNPSGFLAGLLLGSLAGAGAMLLLAPRSGKKTRARIQRKSMKLRDQTAKTVAEGAAQARAKTHQITIGIHKQVEELQQHGQDIFDEGKERFSTVVEAGRTAVQNLQT